MEKELISPLYIICRGTNTANRPHIEFPYLCYLIPLWQPGLLLLIFCYICEAIYLKGLITPTGAYGAHGTINKSPGEQPVIWLVYTSRNKEVCIRP